MNKPNADGSWDSGEKIWNWGFLSGYNLCIFLGIVVAFLTVVYHWRRQKYSWENLQILVILIIPFSIFGARFYTCIFDGGWENFFTFAGMSIYGGVIGAVIPASIYLWFRRHTIDFKTALSIILPTVLIGQAIGRWGNFQNHEVYGKVVLGSSLDWMTGLKSHMFINAPFDPNGLENVLTGNSQYRAPIFFYESMLSLGGYLLLVWVLNDRGYVKPGVSAALYLVYYGIVRLVLQIFRDSSPENTSYFGDSQISVNLVVSSIIIIAGLILAAFWQFRFQINIYWIKISRKEIDSKRTIHFELKKKPLHSKKGFKIWYFTISKGDSKHSIKFNSVVKRVYVDKDIMFGSKKEYELIKPKKEVRRFFVGPKYERTFRIYIPAVDKNNKWSKRELNSGNKKKIN